MIVLRDRYDVLVARDCSWEPSKKACLFLTSSEKFVPVKCRKNEVYLEIKETTKCVGSSNEKEMLTLDHRTSLEEDLLLRCFVPTRLWKVG